MLMEYADIYLWAAAQANARHYGKNGRGNLVLHRRTRGRPGVTDSAGRYYQTYRQLCGEIRRRIIKAAPAAGRPSRSLEESPAVLGERLSLF
ncbi:MAG TPA: hypothetical protein VGX71_05870 [Pseudaminobacter sp.]|nr:hypothetical protein [Pseudaminobacter sp.]